VITVDATLLQRPVVGADPQVLRYLTDYAERLLSQLPAAERTLPIDERVRRAVEKGVLEGDFEPETVARTLAMSTRTMQRHLAAAGLSFQEILDNVRRATALRLLREPAATIHEVAFVLGYGDVPSFYRAFRRWTGQTPAEIRKALRSA